MAGKNEIRGNLICAAFILGMLLQPSLVTAASPAAEDMSTQPNVIMSAYKEVMLDFFKTMSNLSKTAKSEADFYRNLLNIKKGFPEYAKFEGLEKSKNPVILQVKDGIELKEGAVTTAITLSDELGKLTVKTTGGKKSAQLIHFLLPAAQAGVIADGVKRVGSALFLRPIANLVEAGDGMLLTDGSILSASERVAKFAQGAAVLSAEGAVTVCALAVTLDEKCSDGAMFGAAIGFAAGLSAFGVVPIAEHGPDLVNKLATKIDAMKPLAKVPGAPQMLKNLNIAEVAGTLGVAAVAAKYFEPSVFIKGGRMVCSSKKDYRFESLSGEVLYAVGAGDSGVKWKDLEKAVFFGPFWENDFDSNCANYVKNCEKMADEPQKALKESIKSEFKARAEICEKHGAGYSKTYHFESKEHGAVDAVRAKGTN